MGVLGRLACLLLILETLCIGSSFASHKTNKVPMPEGATIWDVCMDTPDVIEHHYIGCYMQLDAFMASQGTDMQAQCDGLQVLNDCIKMNVSLHCPDLYRQFYRDMSSFLPTVVLFCGSPMGLVSIEEWEHIVWIHFEQLYFDYLATLSTTETPDVTTASDVKDDVTMAIASNVSNDNMTQEVAQNNDVDDVNGTTNATHAQNDVNGTHNGTNAGNDVDDDMSSDDDDDKMVTKRMKDDIRNVTERFMAATTAAPRAAADATTAPRRVSLMEVLTTASTASQTLDEDTK